jgi:hypothetical protein
VEAVVLKVPVRDRFSTSAPSRAANKPTPQALEVNERFEMVLKLPRKTPLKAVAVAGVGSQFMPMGEFVFADAKSMF